jgi:serine/threonine protein kinase
MNDRRELVSDLFDAALKRSPDERIAFLREACRGDHALQQELEELLQHDPAQAGFLETPAAAMLGVGRVDPARMLGRRLGPYEIIGLLGAGGMGEVYRATDTNLKRQVAVKVLPAALAADTERLTRFQREAEVLASLNHPHIAHIHGLERSGGTTALVMELVEGPTLADRIARGPIPVDETLDIAKQITEALEAAHEQGIIHRDLKPANVKLRGDGTVKVLDFGLAKVLEPAVAMSPGVAQSPTITSPAMMTGVGMLLGTAAYMSPEQVRGRPVDKRADIWAFGCVLFEMLSGKRPFDGETVTDTLARVLQRHPDWDDLPVDTPLVLRSLLRRCLEKDSHQRLHDIVDARLWLEEAPHSTSGVNAAPPPSRTSWFVLTAGVLCLIAGTGLAIRGGRSAPQDDRTIQFSISPPSGTSFDGILSATAVSPDGRSIVFAANTLSSDSGLYLHSLDSGSTRLLGGTEHGDYPFWSPDSQSIAFIALGRLKRIQAGGGPPVDLGEAPATSAGDWAGGFLILGLQGGLWRIGESSGTRERITTVDTADGEAAHLSPQVLPDGNHFLYYVLNGDPRKRGVYLSSFANPKERRLVLAALNKAQYAPSRMGQPDALVYVRGQALLAQRFDLAHGLIGEPSVIAEPIARAGGLSANAGFWVASTGMLVYRKSDAEMQRRLVWKSREGVAVEQLPRENRYSSFFLSPDQKRVSIDVMNENGIHDVWIYNLGRNMMIPQTSNPANDFLGVWSPDGHQMVFGSSRTGVAQLYLTTVGGGAAEVLITDGPIRKYPLQWTRDGKYVLYRATNPDSGQDELWALTMDGDRKSIPIVRSSSASAFTGQVSPDGKWIVYQSTLTGTNEIYAQRFPVASGFVTLSNKGGRYPTWRADDGKEVYFVSGDDRLTAVTVDPSADDLGPQPPIDLFRVVVPGNLTHTYDVSGNGKRFLVLESAGRQDTPLEVFTNWRSRTK